MRNRIVLVFFIFTALTGCGSFDKPTANLSNTQKTQEAESLSDKPSQPVTTAASLPPVIDPPPAPALPPQFMPVPPLLGDYEGNYSDCPSCDDQDDGENTVFCHTQEDCNDNNPCTNNVCDLPAGTCANTPIPGCAYCEVDQDCIPGPTCTEATCCNNVCSYPYIDECVYLAAIAVTPFDPSIPSSTNQAFTATGTYSNGAVVDITSIVTWTSSDTSIATISNTIGTQGVASAHNVGSTMITANLDDIYGFINLNITALTNR